MTLEEALTEAKQKRNAFSHRYDELLKNAPERERELALIHASYKYWDGVMRGIETACEIIRRELPL